MHLINPFTANDWNIKKLLTAVLGIQLILWLLIGLDSYGVELPIIRPLFAVLSILFLPGILLLRILRLHKLGSVETLLYAVGLSLAFSMAVGFLVNLAGVTTGFSRPISLLPILISISAGVFVLSLLAYNRDKNFDDPEPVRFEDRSLRWFLFLCILPFLSIFGPYSMNYYASNILTLILYLVIGFSVLYIAFSAKFPKELYPLAIFAVALSMLFSTSLVSHYLWGWDIQAEYFSASLVVRNGAWDWTYPSDYNAMLSVVIIPPIVSILAKLDLASVFKVVYSLLFALMPVGLYAAFKRITEEKIAFLSAFFVIASITFFIDLPGLARQQIAELFLALILLLLVSNEIKGRVRTYLLLVFSVSLIVSHYSLAIIYVGMFLATVFALTIVYYRKPLFMRRKALKLGRSQLQNDIIRRNVNRSDALSVVFAFLFIVVAYVWYAYASGGSIFDNFFLTADYFASSFFGDIGGSAGISSAVATAPTPLHYAATWLRLLFQFFILIGVIVTLSKRGSVKRNNVYLCFASASLFLLAAAAFLPNIAGALNITRFYHIALLILAPFCVVGGIFLVNTAQRYLSPARKSSAVSSLRVIAMLLFIAFLFESNTIYQIIEHDAGSVALNNQLDWPLFNTQEEAGAHWWYALKDNSTLIYADNFRNLLFVSLEGGGASWGRFTPGVSRTLVSTGGGTPNSSQQVDVAAVARNSYVFLGTKNIEKGGLAIREAGGYNYLNQSAVLSGRSEVYDSGGSQVYFG